MIYNVENTYDAGRPVEAVIDANGLEWRDTLEVDTQTGRIVRYARDADGGLVINTTTGNLVREEVFAAPPILVKFRPTADR